MAYIFFHLVCALIVGIWFCADIRSPKNVPELG